MSDDVNNDNAQFCIKRREVNKYYIYLDGDIGEASEYRDIFNLIREATPSDVIILVLNTYGGYVDTALQFYDYLQKCQAVTIAEIHVACSAGSIIALACELIRIAAFGFIMIHDFYNKIEGKFSDIKTTFEYYEKEKIDIITNVYNGFLTDDEIQQVIDGHEFWFNKEEILQRIEDMKNETICDEEQ